MEVQVPKVVFDAQERLLFSSWVEHTPFAMFVTSQLTPGSVVELGVHNGVSLCSFAQAARKLNLSTQMFGIDSFEGDVHAGFHSEHIYTNLKEYIEVKYPDSVTLLKGYFNDFLEKFADHSIDILHIDGMHSYEAVKSDYDSWVSKVKTGGLILFHDTKVFENEFGVWKLWAELTLNSPGFEFDHGYGLGVLPVGNGPGIELVKMLNLNKEMYKDVFSSLGRSARLDFEKSDLEKKMNYASLEISKLNATVSTLRNNLDLVQNSKSWRVTAPLRQIMRLIKKEL
jgi:hypothetical protein